MKIVFKEAYKSLWHFTSDELNGLTIITGKNGSGKSQLVNQIKMFSEGTSNKNTVPTLDFLNFNGTIYVGELEPNNYQSGNPKDYKDIIDGWYNNISSIHNSLKNLVHLCFQNNVSRNKLISINTSPNEVFEKFHTLFAPEKASTFIDLLKEISQSRSRNMPLNQALYHNVINEIILLGKSYDVAKHVYEYTGTNVFDLSSEEFHNTPIPEMNFDSTELISSKIDKIFYAYLMKWHKNSWLQYRKERFGEENNSITEDEFEKKFKKPWRLINSILIENKIPFYFEDIDERKFNPDAHVHFGFFKTGTPRPINFSDLSSGEKIIISLILRLFYSEFYEENLNHPDLIVMDEPDAHLHPEMSKMLINILHKTFVDKLGIRVIITTHSPATVALAPEESIYQLTNGRPSSLKKISKDDALKILTSGLPNLSIDYKNHRQIFVESPTDLQYYQTIFNKIKEHDKITHELYFISNGYGKGSCDQVIKLVTDLRNADNKTCFGIIDWDKQEKNENNVLIHAHQKRYSIENIIFDPIYLSVLLLKDKYTELSQRIGFKETDNEYDLIKDIDKLIQAVNFILDKVRTKIKPKNEETTGCEYGNGITLDIPKWYLEHQGHTLESVLYECFPPLLSYKKRGEHELSKTLINLLGKLFPCIPKETIDLINTLSNS